MQQSSFTVTASHPLIWSTRDGTTVRCLTVAESGVLMGFPRGWQLPQGSRAGLRAVGNAVAAACRNGRRRGANTGAGWRRGRGCARAAVQGRSSPLTHAQVPPPLAHAVMAAAVRVHAPAPAAPVPAAPPAGDDDPDDLHALRRKLRRLTERVDALEAAAAPEG